MAKIGRPRDDKTAQLGPFRITPENLDQIRGMAKAQRMTMTDFVTVACLGSDADNLQGQVKRLHERVDALTGDVERLQRLAELGGFES